jgi:hypothetical protein
MAGGLVLSPTTVRIAGVLTGLAAFAALVIGTRLPPGPEVLGVDVTIAIAPTGELGVQPAGPMFIESGLRPGQQPRQHATQVMNRTGQPLLVTVKARPNGDDLDGALRLDLQRDRQPLWSGAERDLRSSRVQFRLEPGHDMQLGVAATVPAEAEHWSGRVVNVDLVLSSAVVT